MRGRCGKRKLPLYVYGPDKKHTGYQVRIYLDNKPYYLGSYSTVEEAETAVALWFDLVAAA